MPEEETNSVPNFSDFMGIGATIHMLKDSVSLVSFFCK